MPTTAAYCRFIVLILISGARIEIIYIYRLSFVPNTFVPNTFAPIFSTEEEHESEKTRGEKKRGKERR